MKKKIFVFLFLASLFFPVVILAQETMPLTSPSPMERLKKVAVGPYAEADETSAAVIVGTIARAVMSLLGVIFVILIIVAGYGWMTAGGNEDQVKQARKRMVNAIIGLVIVISAWTIWALVDDFLIEGGKNIDVGSDLDDQGGSDTTDI